MGSFDYFCSIIKKKKKKFFFFFFFFLHLVILLFIYFSGLFLLLLASNLILYAGPSNISQHVKGKKNEEIVSLIGDNFRMHGGTYF